MLHIRNTREVQPGKYMKIYDTGKITILNREYIFQLWFFHCHVSLFFLGGQHGTQKWRWMEDDVPFQLAGF